jgi:hypothetical protein
VWFGVFFVYSILFIFASFKIKKLEDNFFIKVEMRTVGTCSLILTVVYLVQVNFSKMCSLMELHGSLYGCGTLILCLIGFFMFIFSVCFPLYHASKQSEFPFRVFKNEVSTKTESLHESKHVPSKEDRQNDKATSRRQALKDILDGTKCRGKKRV